MSKSSLNVFSHSGVQSVLHVCRRNLSESSDAGRSEESLCRTSFTLGIQVISVSITICQGQLIELCKLLRGKSHVLEKVFVQLSVNFGFFF